MSRVIGALTFRREVYSEVAHDAGFTAMAWVLVVASNILGQLGTNAAEGIGDPVQWARSTILGTLFAVAAFVVAVAITHGVGRQAFQADVTYRQVVRPLGLASIWSAVGVLGVLVAVSPALNWVVGPARLAALVLAVAAWLVAAREALDLEWLQVVITVVIAWVVSAIVLALAGVFLALFGFGGGVFGGLLG